MSFLFSFCSSKNASSTIPDTQNTERRPVRSDSTDTDGIGTKPDKRSARITELENQIKELKTKLENEKERGEDFEVANERLKLQIKEKAETASQLSEKEKEALDLLAEKEKEFDKLKQELAAAETELQQLKDEENEINTKMKEDYDKQTKEIKSSYEATVARYKNQMDESNKQIVETANKLRACEEERNKLLSTLSSNDKNAKNSNNVVTSQLQNYQKEKKELEGLVDQYKRSMQSLRDQIAAKDLLLSDNKNKQKEEAMDTKRLQDENDQLKSKTQALNSEMKTAQNNKVEVESQQSLLTKQIEELEAQLKLSNSELLASIAKKNGSATQQQDDKTWTETNVTRELILQWLKGSQEKVSKETKGKWFDDWNSQNNGLIHVRLDMLNVMIQLVELYCQSSGHSCNSATQLRNKVADELTQEFHRRFEEHLKTVNSAGDGECMSKTEFIDYFVPLLINGMPSNKPQGNRHSIATSPTIVGMKNFDVNTEVRHLQKLFDKPSPGNELVKEILKYNCQQRVELLKSWPELETNARKYLAGNALDLFLLMTKPFEECDAYWVRQAVSNRSMDAIIEIICTRTNAQLSQLQIAYVANDSKLLDDICSVKKSDNIKQIFQNLLSGKRSSEDDAVVDPAQVKQDAENLKTWLGGKKPNKSEIID
ncbi:viral A-type inclusion protein, partial [Reticulomyxa filosa]